MDVNDLITEAATMAGMLDPIDPLPPEAAAYGFKKLNQMLDEFASERLNIYRQQRVGPFAVTSGQGNITASTPTPITIGAGGTWSTPRPEWIDRAGVIYTAGGTPQPELPMRVFTVKEWSQVVVKGITATLSRALFYDRLFDAGGGFGNIYLYPVPSASFNVVLYVPVSVAEFPNDANGNPDFTTVLALPHGYKSMLVSNLAVIMSIGVKDIGADLRDRADTSKTRVMVSNVVTHMDPLSCDEAVRTGDHRNSGWDWIGGGFT